VLFIAVMSMRIESKWKAGMTMGVRRWLSAGALGIVGLLLMAPSAQAVAYGSLLCSDFEDVPLSELSGGSNTPAAFTTFGHQWAATGTVRVGTPPPPTPGGAVPTPSHSVRLGSFGVMDMGYNLRLATNVQPGNLLTALPTTPGHTYTVHFLAGKDPSATGLMGGQGMVTAWAINQPGIVPVESLGSQPIGSGSVTLPDSPSWTVDWQMVTAEFTATSNYTELQFLEGPFASVWMDDIGICG
jgi:hypothetical protein